LWGVLLAIVYFSVAKLSLLLAIPPGYATAVWPPSGIALAAVLILGLRFWPGVWIGAALVNLTVESSLAAAAVIATGNTLEALAGAALIRRVIGAPGPFGRGEDVVKFVAIAGLCPVIAATIALIPLHLVHALPGSELLWNWWTWWQGDAIGIIIIVPLIITWQSRASVRWSLGKALEALCFAVLLLGATWATSGSRTPGKASYPLTFLIAPFIIWAAFPSASGVTRQRRGVRSRDLSRSGRGPFRQRISAAAARVRDRGRRHGPGPVRDGEQAPQGGTTVGERGAWLMVRNVSGTRSSCSCRRAGDQLERGGRAHQGLPGERGHRAHFLRFYPDEDARWESRRTRSRAPRQRGAGTRAGACARTARGSGRRSSSPRARHRAS
jgi:integral membrane sensor domain MASE1